MTRDLDRLEPLQRYLVASESAADQVIRAYSTSFGAATRLLGRRHRRHIRNIYALVRVADELVDGVAADAHLDHDEQLSRLNALETETLSAISSGYSSNPIVHAFATTARESGIDARLTTPFFDSMRTDLDPAGAAAMAREPRFAPAATDPAAAMPVTESHRFSSAAHAAYVYGSAEVVGLMCLRVFIRGQALTDERLSRLENGARNLGAAFQNVNFLRDLADDTQRLQRSYLSTSGAMTDDDKADWVRTIRTQLDAARDAVPLLPADARIGVDCARRLFCALTDRIDNRTVQQILHERVRVAQPIKLALIARSLSTRGVA